MQTSRCLKLTTLPFPSWLEKSSSLQPEILPSSFVLDEVEIKHSTFSFEVTYTLSRRDKITLGTCSRVGDGRTRVLIKVLGGHTPSLVLFTGQGDLALSDDQSN